MTAWQTPRPWIGTGALMLLAAASVAQAQTVITARGGLGASSSVPGPSSGRAAPSGNALDREPCPPPTGSHIPALRDAQGHCPNAARTNPAVRSYSAGDLETTGYTGDLGSALQQLDPSLTGH